MGEIALGAAAVPADEPHRLELGEQVGGRLVDMQHAIDRRARRALARGHQRGMCRVEREVVGDADGVDAGRQQRLIGHAFDAAGRRRTRAG